MKAITPYIHIRRAILFDYFDKFPGIATRSLARMLFREYPYYFSGIENARCFIRYYRGSSGTHSRDNIAIKKYIKDE